MISFPEITRERFDAILFDLDGVLTATATLHAAAWKQMFDIFLKRRAESAGSTSSSPSTAATTTDDTSMAGRASMGSAASWHPDESVCRMEHRPIRQPPKPSADSATRRMRSSTRSWRGKGSRHIRGRSGRWTFCESRDTRRRWFPRAKTVPPFSPRPDRVAFDVRVDGQTASDLGLAGKPEPDMFLAAARQLGVEPARAIVVEDAIAGVRAGKKGGFGLVIGIARAGNSDALRQRRSRLRGRRPRGIAVPAVLRD